jgi:hypothetical protein
MRSQSILSVNFCAAALSLEASGSDEFYQLAADMGGMDSISIDECIGREQDSFGALATSRQIRSVEPGEPTVCGAGLPGGPRERSASRSPPTTKGAGFSSRRPHRQWYWNRGDLDRCIQLAVI